MIELLTWFQTNHPQLKKDLLACHHNVDDRDTNPYHVEGDCWSHTMMVCKIAQLKGYDRVVQTACLLHDIGKPASRKINPKNNHVQFFGHEARSAKMATPLLQELVERSMLTSSEAKEVEVLIALHGEVYKNYTAVKQKLHAQPHVWKHLLELSICDDLGRFSKSMREVER